MGVLREVFYLEKARVRAAAMKRMEPALKMMAQSHWPWRASTMAMMAMATTARDSSQRGKWKVFGFSGL